MVSAVGNKGSSVSSETVSMTNYIRSLFAMAREISVGRDFHSVPDITEALEEARADSLDFIVVPLVHPRFRRTFGKDGVERSTPFTRSDMQLSSSEWTRLVVGKVSPWLDLDSVIPCERRNSEQALQQELGFACHLGVPAVKIMLRSYQCANLASVISPYLKAQNGLQFWIHVPLESPAATLAAAGPEGDSVEDDAVEGSAGARQTRLGDTWEWWNTLRTLCPASAKICVALELSANLPAPAQLVRWLGEPVKAVVVPVNVFLVNAKGFPVLSKAHQAVVRQLLKFRPQFILSGNPHHGDRTFGPYYKYLRHLNTTQPPRNSVEEFAEGYEDFLQSPLQPLMDNLESQTYEVFEKDPIKYKQYQEAVRRALVDRAPDGAGAAIATVVVMVVGAGRGPLVACTLAAGIEANRRIRVYAIEKNPNAIVTLKSRNTEQWGGAVKIVATDMRAWQPPEKADILVSELLGSFGDNELSPECLDGAQKLLKDDGVSIPSKYTSYLCPMTTPKLHTDVTSVLDKGKLETPFVVMLHNMHLMSDIKPCFVFEHPNPDVGLPTGSDNTRYSQLLFNVPQAGTMHGFAGYFDSVLYKDVMISIHPASHSPGMFSWFPIYFPIKTPMYVPAGSTVHVHFWRKVSRTQVWYEWVVTDPVATPIHNVGGSAYFIGL